MTFVWNLADEFAPDERSAARRGAADGCVVFIRDGGGRSMRKSSRLIGSRHGTGRSRHGTGQSAIGPLGGVDTGRTGHVPGTLVLRAETVVRRHMVGMFAGFRG